jgi:transcription termination factor NusB
MSKQEQEEDLGLNKADKAQDTYFSINNAYFTQLASDLENDRIIKFEDLEELYSHLLKTDKNILQFSVFDESLKQFPMQVLTPEQITLVMSELKNDDLKYFY